jgi:hypothetical protein
MNEIDILTSIDNKINTVTEAVYSIDNNLSNINNTLNANINYIPAILIVLIIIFVSTLIKFER